MGVLERDIMAACAVGVARARCEREYAGEHDRAPQTVAVPGHTQHLLTGARRRGGHNSKYQSVDRCLYLKVSAAFVVQSRPRSSARSLTGSTGRAAQVCDALPGLLHPHVTASHVTP